MGRALSARDQRPGEGEKGGREALGGSYFSVMEKHSTAALGVKNQLVTTIDLLAVRVAWSNYW